jgi:predicted O-methyltransferase YrrM
MSLKRTPKRALVSLASTRSGRRAISTVLKAKPELAIELAGPAFNREPRFTTRELPQALNGFEDVAFLFANTMLDHGIISMTVDEAAYVYRLVRGLPSATIVEIGRFKGGSTFLLAAAMDSRSELTSYDLRVKLPGAFDYEETDRELLDALGRFRRADRVQLVVADSRSATPPARPCDLLFLDGDHTYEGVRADFDHWRTHLAPGAHVLFHDATPSRFHSFEEGVARLIDELERSGGFRRVGTAGSIVHLQAEV